MRQAPGFWSRPPDRPGAAARLLAPAAAVWAWAAARRLARGDGYRADVPVICVGNATAGGTGKTPTAMAVVDALARRGHGAHVVLRGYGGRLAGPVRVDPASHEAADVGDEALLLAAVAPAWVARDRAAGVRAAAAAGAAAVVLDDGLQNPAVAKDLSLLVVDAAAGFGNGRVIPAGPLREPVAAAVARSDLLISYGSAAEHAALVTRWPALTPLPTIRARLEPLATGVAWTGVRILAFAGIGRPEKFFQTLRAAGADVVATRSFADHEPYSSAILSRLTADARRLGAQLVTTEKDAVRLPADVRRAVRVFPVRAAFEDPAPLAAALDLIGL